MSGDDPDVLVRIENRVGHLTLNRPRALNALTHGMVRDIAAALDGWADNPEVAVVLIDGAGSRGLCAGGDIRAIHDAIRAGDHAAAGAFFRDEYRLNARIAAYPKPYVAFMDGIVMGGGVGVSAHGAHRVVTQTTRLAMPETGIGFVPDIGATWLLGRIPGHLGLHLALAGAELGPADAIACGLADSFVPSAGLPALAAALGACDSVPACIAAHAVPPPPGALDAARGWIEACYAGADMPAIIRCLSLRPEAPAQAAAALAGKSPTSLAVTLRAVREAATLPSLNAALEQEYRLVLHAIRCPDFIEGVRAAVIDKDRRPRWEATSEAKVQAFRDAKHEELF